MKVHHLGYLVDNIETAVIEFENLGYRPHEEIGIDSIREIKVIFMGNSGYLVELIQPIDENSPIYGLRKKYKNSPYHICYETNDIHGQIRKFVDGGMGILITEPQIAPVMAGNPLVAFIMN